MVCRTLFILACAYNLPTVVQEPKTSKASEFDCRAYEDARKKRFERTHKSSELLP